MTDTILTVKNLSLTLGELTVFKNLNFEIRRGEISAVIGPNGAGKTALFRALIGSLSYQGDIVWASGAKIGYVPQRFDLDRNLSLTLRDFLMLKVKILRLPKNAASEAAKLVHLPESKFKNPLSRLSSGELQRVLIASALIGSPNVLLFDEPTAGIDLPGEERIYQTLHELSEQKQLTIIFISHDLNLVYRYADKVICLNRAMFCSGTPKETLTPSVLDALYGDKVHHQHHY